MPDHDYVQFAAGLNGDEDLGQDITMKNGVTMHYTNPASERLINDDLI